MDFSDIDIHRTTLGVNLEDAALPTGRGFFKRAYLSGVLAVTFPDGDVQHYAFRTLPNNSDEDTLNYVVIHISHDVYYAAIRDWQRIPSSILAGLDTKGVQLRRVLQEAKL